MKKVFLLFALFLSVLAFGQIQEGDQAPDFTLNNATGKPVQLSELLKAGPVVLTWYRGSWCPYCNIALTQLQSNLPRIKSLHATLVALTPELPDKTLTTKEKNHLDYEVLSDIDLQVARKYGVVLPSNPKLPIPATLVIDTAGVVKYVYVNEDYKERANPKDLIRVLEQLQ